MKSWSMRILFAVLLLAALVNRIQASHEVERDVQTAILALLESQGLTARLERPPPTSALEARVTFDVPGCSGPVQVLPVGLNLQVSPLFDAAVGPGYDRHFVYLGKVWSKPSRFDLRRQWFEHKVLSIWGLGRFAPDTTALLVAEPPGCRAAEAIDWAPLWYRRPRAS